ncbi:energy transducer TonB [Puniceicoccaceae bacterium K14]|nr:energy transducer TonB [Puniceicoccaceae bacterium K14]
MKSKCFPKKNSTILRILSISSLFLCLLQNASASPGDVNGVSNGDLNVNVTKQPKFPYALKTKGITEGSATVIVSVDENGKLVDWIATEATHRSFAREVNNVIEEWIFELTETRKEGRSTVVQIEVDFTVDGPLVINPDMVSVMRSEYDLGLIDTSEMLKYYSVRDLDRLPEPTYIEKPIIPEEIIGNKLEKAVFEFYIDQKGEVHLPILRSRDIEMNDEALIIAQEAIRKWKFIPPTVKGNTVVTKVAQQLYFRKGE